jgi:hypothetical protein
MEKFLEDYKKAVVNSTSKVDIWVNRPSKMRYRCYAISRFYSGAVQREFKKQFIQILGLVWKDLDETKVKV